MPSRVSRLAVGRAGKRNAHCWCHRSLKVGGVAGAACTCCRTRLGPGGERDTAVRVRGHMDDRTQRAELDSADPFGGLPSAPRETTRSTPVTWAHPGRTCSTRSPRRRTSPRAAREGCPPRRHSTAGPQTRRQPKLVGQVCGSGGCDARYAWGDEPPTIDRCDFNRFEQYWVIPPRPQLAHGTGCTACAAGSGNGQRTGTTPTTTPTARSKTQLDRRRGSRRWYGAAPGPTAQMSSRYRSARHTDPARGGTRSGIRT